ncbi:C1 family peptidase [Pelagibius sp.]|uniref:C1 family peptidase n=1 Tax=Pelagibius sp. TaxID=1931238 RepID=UPI002628CA10|nr:C1 family peptidase [Pelagibius sp.]
MPGSGQGDGKVYSGVVKDPLDLRDLMYESGLFELPFKLDNRKRVPVVLDQGKEGACTGFGLAAVVNFLHHNRGDFTAAQKAKYKKKENGASARMLYEMAKRYDEWQGENYDGSSVRGAMKGWAKHGVCSWRKWPYNANKPGRLTPPRQFDALRHPLGAYYRVRHLYLNQMQAALKEAGILYASASVHDGWSHVGGDGIIRYSPRLIGGHAFAIVGYDDRGFWVQNSWGPRWGLKGFCHLGYDDWLQNGYDCWVARLGVPVLAIPEDQRDRVHGRAAEFGYVADEAVELNDIRPHFVNLGNDGRFSQSGRYSSDPDDVEDVVLKRFKEISASWSGPRKLAIYCHGGLNSEKASAARIASLRPYFLANQIYPLHFMWETGALESIRGIVQDAFRRGRFQGWADRMKERFYDLLDEGVELGAQPLGKPLWNQMKDNATRASVDAEGGARFTAKRIKSCFDGMSEKTELHLVGHSAGSIFLAHLVPVLSEIGQPVKSLTLFAPACALSLFDEKIAGHIGQNIERFVMFNLTDAVERDDSVGPAYHKSLLYLVTEAFEQRHRVPLLGMEAFIDPANKAYIKLPPEDRKLSKRVQQVIGKAQPGNGRTTIRALNVPTSIKLDSDSTTHGGFDNDEATLNSTLRIITGKQSLAKAF